MAYVEGFLTGLNDYLNISRKLTDGQPQEIAKLICQEFYYLNLGDLKLAFDRIKLGKVELFEGLDGMKIMMVIRDYEEERHIAAEAKSRNKIFPEKEEKGVPIPDDVAEKIKEAFRPKKKEIPPQPEILRPQSKPHEDDYYRLWREWRIEHPDKNPHLFEKEFMTLEAYVRSKVEETEID